MKALTSIGVALAIAAPAWAQTGGPAAHAGMGHGQKAQGAAAGHSHSGMHQHGAGMDHGAMMQNSAANPYAESEMRMHHAMMKATGPDASETWVRKMIEHHRGAVEMSRIALGAATDAEARSKAQATIASQEREIAELQAWLRKKGRPAQ